MAHHVIRKSMVALAGTAFAWTALIRPRTKPPAELKRLGEYDYAHRGYHDADAGIPENSMAAFRQAVQAGFGIELDVHLSRDGHLVVMHDENLKRMCGVDLKIGDLTWEELRHYRLQNTEEEIPDLEQVLTMVAGKVPLIVEVKPCSGNHVRLCRQTCRELEDYKGLYCLESFDPRAVVWIRHNYPELVRGQLLSYLRRSGNQEYSAVLDFILHNLLTNCWTRPDFIAYHIEERDNLSLRLCRKLYHVQQVDWTVRTPEEYKKVKKDGSIAIFEHFDPRNCKEKS